MAALVDTGILLALANKRDANHEAAIALLSSLNEALLVSMPVLAEAAYLTNRVLGVEAEARLVASLGRGEMQLEEVTRSDCLRAESCCALTLTPTSGLWMLPWSRWPSV